MGIDRESDVSANLQIGPTTLGMVRLYIEGDGVDLPLDFDPDEAEEIAAELVAAAAKAREGRPLEGSDHGATGRNQNRQGRRGKGSSST